MDISNILNVATSLFFLFLVLSMVTSVFQEMVAGIWNSRGQGLRAAIGQLLGDPEFVGLAKRVYSHKLIAGLVQPGIDLPSLWWIRRLLPFVAARLPSYIPKETFADAIIDILRRNGAFMTGSMQPGLAALWTGVGEDQAAFRTKVMEWYTAGTDRQSGIYKRGAQRWLFTYGILVAAALNADTIEITRYLLSKGVEQRAEAIADRATEFLKEQGGELETVDLSELLGELPLLELPIGWKTTDGCKIAGYILPPQIAKLICPTEDTGALDSQKKQKQNNQEQPVQNCEPSDTIRTLCTVDAARVFGWVLTALAISLGAQFWFDTLGKIVGLRASGNKPKSGAVT